jgi:hypothetical protein
MILANKAILITGANWAHLHEQVRRRAEAPRPH